jgi:hypothetical protein
MSTRRSGRATKEVKYTSASEGSDFEDKKKRAKKQTKTAHSKEGVTTTKKTPKAARVPKKAPPKDVTKKRAAESDNENDDAIANQNDAMTTSTAPKPKRQKKDPTTLAAEAQEKKAKADKAAHKKAWQDWLSSHDNEGEMLEEEPDKHESITQTDALKKYGVKKDELNSLLRFEKKNPLYPGMMKLFLEEDVRELAFRKIGVLEGAQGDDEEIVEKGKQLWTEEHKDDVDVEEEKSVKTETKGKDAARDENADEPAKTEKPKKEDKPAKTKKQEKEKTPKQKWTAYVSENSIDEDERLPKEPFDLINQTDCKNRYNLTPRDLACLPYFPKKNPAYGNTMKIFKESVVKSLAYRKTAVLAGLEDDGKDDEGLLEKGQKLFEEQSDPDKDE